MMDDYFQKLTPEQRQEWFRSLTETYPVLMQRVARLEERVLRLERARRMTAAEALESYDALKRLNPGLTLQTFADDHGLKYGTLMRARQRQRQRDK